MSFDLEGLKKFLVAANTAGYASGDESTRITDPDGSTSIRYSEGPWEYHDNYDGGEPFCGRIRVCFQGRPIWNMAYYGAVEPHVKNIKPVYSFLTEALGKMPEVAPFRGPSHHVQRFSEEIGLEYQNRWTGAVEKFEGYEQIFNGNELLYSASYFGGLVNSLDFE